MAGLWLNKTRLIVNIDDLRDYVFDSKELADGYIFLCLMFHLLTLMLTRPPTIEMEIRAQSVQESFKANK
jgi:hypothetical protein